MQDLARADLASAPQSLTWLVYCRENKLLTASEWALAAILVTLGKGQNITLSVVGMADITRMKRDTVRKAIDSLEAKGLLVFVRPGRNQTKVYRLTLPRCPNGEYPGGQMGTTQVAESVPPGGQMGTTTSKENKERFTRTTQHQHPMLTAATAAPSGKTKDRATSRAKATARSTSTRAKDDFPALEDYIADIEDVVDELEHRLGMAPGTVDIKPLAKLWRDLMVRHGEPGAGVSHTLTEFPADARMWSRCARADRPVGYFLCEIGRWLSEPECNPADDAAEDARGGSYTVDDDLSDAALD
jgi:hypothetical protein